MFDLKNREYKEVFGYCPEEKQVCLKMKNKLSYLIDIRNKKVYVHADPWDFFKMEPYFEPGSTIPKELLSEALEVLKNAKLPELSKKENKQFEQILKDD